MATSIVTVYYTYPLSDKEKGNKSLALQKSNKLLVRENMRKHDPKSPFLIGNAQAGDKIHEADQKSWLDMQMRMDI